ncbi:hypothetical protein [Roseateles sp.]|uniref:hypothetical protein n=1 Tax=Roseateles sp. TaxID=1971397 RepID=UPI0039EBBFB5
MPYANAATGPLGEPTGLLNKDDAFAATLLRDGPEVDIGVYLSRRNLVAADLELIEAMVNRARRDGTLRKIYLRYYPEAAVKAIQF